MIPSLLCFHVRVILTFLEKHCGSVLDLYFLFIGCGFWVLWFVFHIEVLHSKVCDLPALPCDCLFCRRRRYFLLCSRRTPVIIAKWGHGVLSSLDVFRVRNCCRRGCVVFSFACVQFRVSSIVNSALFVCTLCNRGRIGGVRRL